jgi:hypothetical protein
MKNVLIAALLITAWTQSAFAQSPRAVIRELRGTVETKAPDSSVWEAAVAGSPPAVIPASQSPVAVGVRWDD